MIAAIKAFGPDARQVGFKVEAGKNTIELYGKDGMTATLPCGEIKQGVSKVIYLSHDFILQALKHIEGNNVLISFDEQEKGTRAWIQSDNKDYTYITVAARPEYSPETTVPTESTTTQGADQ